VGLPINSFTGAMFESMAERGERERGGLVLALRSHGQKVGVERMNTKIRNRLAVVPFNLGLCILSVHAMKKRRMG
jgi:hypothetical protein